MFNFSPLSIGDKEKVDRYLQLDGSIMSDRTFASLCIWGPQFNLKYCIENGFLYLAIDKGNYFAYYMPLGMGSLTEPLQKIRLDAKERGVNHSIVLITNDRLDEIKSILGNDYDISPTPNRNDYVYLAEKMISLGGKKLHSKRNFVNRFKKEFEGRWEYRDIDPVKDRAEITNLLLKWGVRKEQENYKESYEYGAVSVALDNYDALGMCGGCILLDNKIIAFTLAAPQNDEVMDILIEKADYEIIGSYQMINREFALHNCKEYKYINREEDMGIEGLRKAKLSYHPAFQTEKYVADFKG